MKPEDLDRILSKPNAYIIAPAGHGKTEMIVDLVIASAAKVLLLTHTNAGVDALKKRLKKRNVDDRKFSISTIAGFCMRWCAAYPATSSTNGAKLGDEDFYPKCYAGAATIFSAYWARNVIKSTYSCVIVDEYQDCVTDQHNIFLNLSESVPVYVLGDPLQAIFGWAGKLVSWKDLGFEEVEVDTYPWRWHETNPELGQFLQKIRERLLPSLDGQQVRLLVKSDLQNPSIKIISSDRGVDWKFLNGLKRYSRVLYITKWPSQQRSLCQMTRGIFQNDEPQSLNELFGIAKSLDKLNAEDQAIKIYEFLLTCANHVNEEIGSYRTHISNRDFNFGRIKKHTKFGELINNLLKNQTIDDIYNIFSWVKSTPAFNIYRIELFDELLRALSHAKNSGCSIEDAARQIRTEPKMQKRYSEFKFLSSRTVLSKGLEFECVVIDASKQVRDSDRYCATDFYVALTRATKAIYIITDDQEIVLRGLK